MVPPLTVAESPVTVTAEPPEAVSFLPPRSSVMALATVMPSVRARSLAMMTVSPALAAPMASWSVS